MGEIVATEDRDLRGKDDQRDPRHVEGAHPDRRDRRGPHDDRDLRRDDDERDTRVLNYAVDGPWIRNILVTIVAGGYTLLGASLCLEPYKWDRTPAYAILLDILPQRGWGLILLGVAGLLGCATWVTQRYAVTIIAYVAAILFTAGWMFAFAVRWWTDPKDATTPMNAVTWLVLTAVLILSWRAVERYRVLAVDPSELS